jgi:hypothetical protein
MLIKPENINMGARSGWVAVAFGILSVVRVQVDELASDISMFYTRLKKSLLQGEVLNGTNSLRMAWIP